MKPLSGRISTPKRSAIWLIASLFLLQVMLAGCGWIEPGKYSTVDANKQARELVIWMLSDIQPPIAADHVDLERAIVDVNQNIEQVDIGIMAGDLVKSRAQEDEFRWFLDTRNRSRVSYWYEVAGNHDMRSQPLFSSFFPRPEYYGVRIGNLLILLLSDTSTDSASHITDEAFSWWRDMVMAHQDYIVITVSHASLRHSGLLGSIIPSRQIVDSDRFEEVLRNFRVDLWVSGHTHLPQGWAGTATCNDELSGSCFINVSSIARKPLVGSESRFLYLEEGSNKGWIRSREHSKNKFNPGLDLPIELSHRFRWSGEEPWIILPPDSPET